jgi:hypothetical protein
MQKSLSAETRRNLLFCLFVFGLFTAFAVVPYRFHSQAGSQDERAKAANRGDALKNYDIRADKSAGDKIVKFRRIQNKSAAAVADIRDDFVAGEEKLRVKVPNLKVEYNRETVAPEVIAPDVKKGRAFLTEPSAIEQSRADKLRGFIRQNDSLIGFKSARTEDLRVTADYVNPDGNLSFARLTQHINDIPVFNAEVKAGFTKKGEIVRVVNSLAPGVETANVSTDFGDPANAVKAAADAVNHDLNPSDLTQAKSLSGDDKKIAFGTGDWATTAEKMYFPVEPGVAIPAWRVLIWEAQSAFYVIVDAETSTMLWRKNITEDQTQPATYSIYANPNAMINVADSPSPLTPGPDNPALGTQGTPINRTEVTLVGNEAPYTFNNKGWITDGNNTTDGNAVQAGLDRVAPDGVDAPLDGNNRVFSYNFNPAPGNPAPGDDPLGAEAQKGGVTNLFYIVNRYHDELYRLGFTEAAGNFQNDNFGRGGVGNDRISAQSQDNICSSNPEVVCSNNANFGTAADGTRGRMQMFLWTRPNPDRDGSLDAEVVIHELTHGLSNRLHGNASGLTGNMARGMGEGWSDFYAHSLLSEPADPLNGVYTTGGYDTFQGLSGYNANYFYGIRRFPKALMSATGGPNNKPFNPLTFADADSTQYNVNDGAFSRGPYGASIVDQVHNLGEIWSSMLWEVRGKFIARLGWEVGNRRVLQYVTDGMKLAPSSPTMIQERDAIIAAAQASLSAPQANADVIDIWEGFRIRGMGFSAKVNNAGSGDGDTRVTEAFDMPNLAQTPRLTVSDSSGDGDGFPEPGEKILLNISLNNNTGANATGATAQIVGGATANFGTILNNSTAAQQISYTVPAGAQCGSSIALTINVNSSLGTVSFTDHIVTGVEKITFTESFDNAPVPALPTGWTTNSTTGKNFVTTNNNADSTPNSAFIANPSVTNRSDLTSPVMPIASQAAILSFRNRFDTENGWDGGVLEIKIGDGEFQDIIAAGGRFIEGGYNSSLGKDSALEYRNAWTGFSGGYLTTKVQLPAAAAGKNVQLKWSFGSDSNTAEIGWNIDTIRLAGSYTCDDSGSRAIKSRADYDGDGRTDLSVFRPSDGNWFLSRSRDGFSAVNFGLSGDALVPGDYDGDGKADIAVFRNSGWFILKSSDNSFYAVGFGFSSDKLVPGDYDGDGRTDPAVFRPSNNTWYALNSSGSGVTTVGFGAAGDVPVTGDFDGDGKSDFTVFRRGQWITQLSSGAATFTSWGLATDKPVAADYDGDNKDDVAVYRPETGAWYVLNSSNAQLYAVGFGAMGDVASPGDYDGDGRDDVAVFRAGTWYLLGTTSGFSSAGFGVANDVPTPSSYLPIQ